MSDVRYAVQVDASGAVTSIQKLDAAWKGVDSTHAQTAGSAGRLEKELGRMWMQVASGQLVLDGIKKAWSLFKGAVESGIEGALKEEQSELRLKTAMESMGKARYGAVAGMMEFAKQQSHVTLYTHEEVEASMALLASLTKLDAEGIKRIMPGIEGLASTLGPGEGLEGATRMVQRAMEGQTTGLRRAGIIISETIPKGEQLAEIQRRLAELFPRATSEVDTTAGAIKQAGKSYDEFKEKLGKVIIEGFGFKVIAQEITKALDEGAPAADNATESFLRLAAAQGRFRPGGFGFMFKDYAVIESARLETERIADEMDRFMAGVISKGTPASKAVFDLAAALKDLGFKSTAPLTVELNLANQALAAMLATGTEAPGVIEAMERKIADLKAQLQGAVETFDQMTLRMFNMRSRYPLEPLPTVVTEKGTVETLPKPNMDRQRALEAQFQWLHGEQMAAAEASAEMGRIWENAMGTMLASTVAFGDGTGSVFKGVGEIFGNFVKTAISGIEMMALKEMWGAAMTLKAEKMKALARHIANIFAKVPFPFDLILAAGAFAVINSLFSKILKFKEGGVFTKPTIAEVGHGTEYVLPERKLINLVRDAMRMPAWGGAPAMAMAGGGATVNIYGPLVQTSAALSDAEIRRLGSKLKREVEYQFGRVGG